MYVKIWKNPWILTFFRVFLCFSIFGLNIHSNPPILNGRLLIWEAVSHPPVWSRNLLFWGKHLQIFQFFLKFPIWIASYFVFWCFNCVTAIGNAKNTLLIHVNSLFLQWFIIDFAKYVLKNGKIIIFLNWFYARKAPRECIFQV